MRTLLACFLLAATVSARSAEILGDAIDRHLQSLPNKALQSCAQCVYYKWAYCQFSNLTSQLYTNKAGVCDYSNVLNPSSSRNPPYYCSDMFVNKDQSEWLTMLPCQYYTTKCGLQNQVITMSGTDLQSATAHSLRVGDVCMYQFSYGSIKDNKVWIDSIQDAEVTIVDGIRDHPYRDPSVIDDDYFQQMLSQGEFHTFGDGWYNMSTSGTSYLFIKGTGSNPSVTFSYGYKPLFAKWIIITIASVGGVVLLTCLIICCYCVRKAASKKAEESSKVKKYASSDNRSINDKISRFKYGRESVPISLPELADNGDEMNKPDEWGVPEEGEDNLDFQQLDEPTNYHWQQQQQPWGNSPQGYQQY